MSGVGRLLRRLGGKPAPLPPPAAGEPTPDAGPGAGDDSFEVVSPLQCSEREIERWNREWLSYLGSEWEYQLAPHTWYPAKPPLPDSALGMLKLSLGYGWPIALYCDPDALEGRRVLEMGCGCGNLGKLIARYTESYLGTDYSTLALRIASLVSPPNCTYVHVADRKGLEPFFGTIDTVVGRYFWIHQNLRVAGENLDFLALFLRPGGRIYTDFYWPNPAVEQAVVLSPDQSLSRAYPSATFRYTREDVERLIAGRPFRILREEISPEMQRRYVVLERLDAR